MKTIENISFAASAKANINWKRLCNGMQYKFKLFFPHCGWGGRESNAIPIAIAIVTAIAIAMATATVSSNKVAHS